MNDKELDELLDHWEPPPMRESLREDLRTAYAAAPKRAGRTRLRFRILDAFRGVRMARVAVAAAIVAVVVFGITQVHPQIARMASPEFRIPFYVEFEFNRYDDTGLTRHTSRITTFPYAGHEINMSVTESDNSLLSTLRSIAGSIHDRIVLAVPSLVLPKGPPMAEPAWFRPFVNSGCSIGRNVVGHEIIAGHATTIVEDAFPTHRMTVWMAPDLDCFALKLTTEAGAPNGVYQMRIRKEAVSVTMNP